MIELTRLSGISLVVNSDLIQYVESSPDTTITLIHGEKVVVRETMAEVIRQATAYRASVIRDASKYNLNLPATAATASVVGALVARPGSTDEEGIEADRNAVLRRRTVRS
jgi:flagellar protein FlbD